MLIAGQRGEGGGQGKRRRGKEAGKQARRGAGRGEGRGGRKRSSFSAFLLTCRKCRRQGKVKEKGRAEEGEERKREREKERASEREKCPLSSPTTTTTTMKLAIPPCLRFASRWVPCLLLASAGQQPLAAWRLVIGAWSSSCFCSCSSSCSSSSCTQRFVRCHWKLNKLKLDDVSTKARSGDSTG